MFSQIPDQSHHPGSQRPELLPILVPVKKLGEQRTGPTQIFRLLQAVGRQAGRPHSPRLLRTVQSSDQQNHQTIARKEKKQVSFPISDSFPWPNIKTICISFDTPAVCYPNLTFLASSSPMCKSDNSSLRRARLLFCLVGWTGRQSK